MVAKSGTGWKLAPSLVKLIDEVDERWPGRPRHSDGSVGDLAHAARSSEHNPDRDPDPMPVGYVSALDITKWTAEMIETIRRKLIADPRTWYVIHDGFIYSRTYGFRKRVYTGANAHKGHLHISLMQTARAANDTSSWGIAESDAPAPTPSAKFPVLSRGDKHEKVLLLQRYLGVFPRTGTFNWLTEQAVKRYQRMHRLVPDGVVGPKTWAPIRADLDI